MPVRHSEVRWEGNLKNGNGFVRTGSGLVQGAVAYATRFENETGINPEELIGAALASCYSMSLSLSLEVAGYKPEEIVTKTYVHLDKKDNGFHITQIELETQANVKNVDNNTFQTIAATAHRNCPVAQALQGTEIVRSAKLMQ